MARMQEPIAKRLASSMFQSYNPPLCMRQIVLAAWSGIKSLIQMQINYDDEYFDLMHTTEIDATGDAMNLQRNRLANRLNPKIKWS